MKNFKMFSSGIAMLLFYLSLAVESPLFSGKYNLKTITGVVSDASGPIPGANVYVAGTTRGTQTDIDGKYTIEAVEGEKLVFSFIGMKDRTITVGKSNVINAKLEGGVALSEVVVSAVGVHRRQNDRREKKDKSAPLAAKVSGLQVNSYAVQNSESQVVFRGSRSMSAADESLIVIDGKVATKAELEAMPQNDIVAVNTLKGPQAAALYGSQGVNGAIIITTKHSPLPYNPDPSDESYEEFVENQFESPTAAPLSTFSIDVDNASYTNIRRFINNGQAVPKDAVRVEEMVNFFKYAYPQPTNNEPFSINTDYSDSPWNPNHKLLRIGLQGKVIPSDELPSSNLVFLLDVSGSMNQQNKLPLLIESFKILLNELRSEDKVAIVVYAGAAGMVLPPTSGSEKETIKKALEKLSAGGSTAGGAGIELAYKLATENFIKGGNNRIILATDGDFNVGSSSDKDMQKLIEEKRKSGVFLTCLGFGMGNYKDSKLETLADKGNGNYAYIDNIQEANRFLGKEFKGSMFAIAKDVKIQIEFNPALVQSYRLIGYENRKLRAEDFNNDVIDAGELGSGHTVTALYEIIPVGVKSNYAPEVDALQFKNPTVKANAENQLAFIKFRYKKPDGDKSILIKKEIENTSRPLSQSAADFKFSAAVAWFGLQLRDSKLILDKSRTAVKELASQGLSNDVDGYKAEFFRLVDSGLNK